MKGEPVILNNRAAILIVDDNPKNLQIVGSILQDEGIDAEFAMNGDAALEWIQNRAFDLVLLDVMMPGMNGFQVCRQIKSILKYESLPIIFLTARTDTESIIRGFESGGVDYISKPFNRRELLARVMNHLMLKKASDENKNYLDVIKLKNKLLTYSIQYAQRIQKAILPTAGLMNELLADHFILYLPKDIVSGDFYWIKAYGDHIFIAVADCTGHGVPGALMSILGYTGLNQAVNEYDLTSPVDILSHVHQFLKYALQKTSQESPVIDGMDMTLCRLDLKNNVMECCGANNSIYLVRKEELEIIKGDRGTIGDVDYDKTSLTNHVMKLTEGDIIYMPTDGFADQFGGDSDKKLSYRRLTGLLTGISTLSCSEQLTILNETFREWKKEQEQVDDVSILGIRI